MKKIRKTFIGIGASLVLAGIGAWTISGRDAMAADNDKCATRVVYAVAPWTAANYHTYCNLWNPSGTIQDVSVTAFNSGGLENEIFDGPLSSHEKVDLNVGTSAEGLRFEVTAAEGQTEDGFIVANCWQYHNGGGGIAVSSLVNAGLPF